MTARIGLLGGTFNPIHIGHLMLGEEARCKLKLDKVVYIPTYVPPHKDSEAVISARHRLKMVELAIEGNPAFEVSTIEIDARKKSYSVDTIKMLKQYYGSHAQLYFITGSDSLKDLFSWKSINDIFRMSRFIVATRPGYPVKDVPKEVESVIITPIEVSSEDIRRRVKEGRSIRYIVPEKVGKYIEKHRLYI